MTSTNYHTIEESSFFAVEHTIEQKYKEGVTFTVTIEILASQNSESLFQGWKTPQTHCFWTQWTF